MAAGNQSKIRSLHEPETVQVPSGNRIRERFGDAKAQGSRETEVPPTRYGRFDGYPGTARPEVEEPAQVGCETEAARRRASVAPGGSGRRRANAARCRGKRRKRGWNPGSRKRRESISNPCTKELPAGDAG